MTIAAKRDNVRGLGQICLPITIGKLLEAGFRFVMF
jgi:hypothetical protein